MVDGCLLVSRAVEANEVELAICIYPLCSLKQFPIPCGHLALRVERQSNYAYQKLDTEVEMRIGKDITVVKQMKPTTENKIRPTFCLPCIKRLWSLSDLNRTKMELTATMPTPEQSISVQEQTTVPHSSSQVEHGYHAVVPTNHSKALRRTPRCRFGSDSNVKGDSNNKPASSKDNDSSLKEPLQANAANSSTIFTADFSSGSAYYSIEHVQSPQRTTPCQKNEWLSYDGARDKPSSLTKSGRHRKSSRASSKIWVSKYDILDSAERVGSMVSPVERQLFAVSMKKDRIGNTATGLHQGHVLLTGSVFPHPKSGQASRESSDLRSEKPGGQKRQKSPPAPGLIVLGRDVTPKNKLATVVNKTQAGASIEGDPMAEKNDKKEQSHVSGDHMADIAKRIAREREVNLMLSTLKTDEMHSDSTSNKRRKRYARHDLIKAQASLPTQAKPLDYIYSSKLVEKAKDLHLDLTDLLCTQQHIGTVTDYKKQQRREARISQNGKMNNKAPVKVSKGTSMKGWAYDRQKPLPYDIPQLWCFCSSQSEGDEMVQCDNEDCVIGWFHIQCLMDKEIPIPVDGTYNHP